MAGLGGGGEAECIDMGFITPAMLGRGCLGAGAYNPEKDILISEGPLDDLDHASNTPKYGSKIGIDATSKGKIDGRTRPWPSDIVMSNSIKELVDKKWSKYNINN